MNSIIFWTMVVYKRQNCFAEFQQKGASDLKKKSIVDFKDNASELVRKQD